MGCNAESGADRVYEVRNIVEDRFAVELRRTSSQ
jgi:hypothetical protein